ncbi:MAG: ATP-binding protein [Bacteroidota bacterium]
MQNPFKFLDAFQKDDKELFFGREKETAQLYNAVFASNLTLLYGASGTGKTSLVNCGLGNKFYDTDWVPLFIRRGNNINHAINTAIRSGLTDSIPDDFETLEVPEKLRLLYLDHYKPIYLIFDQFEELFILGSKKEQQQFYQSIATLLKAGLQAKVLLIIREEWIAHLNDLERIIPTLFDNRLRVERMNDRNIYRVISGTARYADIKVNSPSETILAIIDNLRDKNERVDLTNLQVYLDRLFREAEQKSKVEGKDTITFDLSLVRKLGQMSNVLSSFLDEQMTIIEQNIKEKFGKPVVKGLPLEVLFTLVTDDGTKQALDLTQINAALPKNRKLEKAELTYIMQEFERVKLLRALD